MNGKKKMARTTTALDDKEEDEDEAREQVVQPVLPLPDLVHQRQHHDDPAHDETSVRGPLPVFQRPGREIFECDRPEYCG